MSTKKSKIPRRLRRIFYNMKQRCYNPKAKSYNYYGERGITICDEWLNDSFNFYNWSLNNDYKDNLTIDRIDVDGNYEPDNCRWVTIDIQANNRRNNIFLEYEGEVKTVSQWSQEIGVSGSVIKNRFEKGWDISKDVDRIIRINRNGELKTIKELSEESGIPYKIIERRHCERWKDEDLTNEITPNETKLIEINGEIHTATEWARISGLTREIILNRINYGWATEDLLKPREHNGKKKYIEIEGESHTIDEWCEIIGISRYGFYCRIKRGLKGKELLGSTNNFNPK